MELIRGIHNLRPRHRGCVATIGNFDGVHLGHQAVLGQLAERGAELGLPAVVITFEPQPAEFFTPEQAPARLTRFREKLEAFRRYAVERVLVLRFDQALASLAAEDFILRVLVEGLDIRYLVVGDDFRFGKGRSGNFELLQARGEEHGFQVVNMHTFEIAHERVSSTRVRDALAVGDIALAESLLGRPYRITGRVARGEQRGRTIGFPTANIHLHRAKSSLQGVYAVEVFGLEREPLEGVANLGRRPTVGGTRLQLEVHLFNFAQNIYGRNLHVNFLYRIRDERKFDSFDALRQQIDEDVTQAKGFFAHRA